jgi:AbiV family abortive infection protein
MHDCTFKGRRIRLDVTDPVAASGQVAWLSWKCGSCSRQGRTGAGAGLGRGCPARNARGLAEDAELLSGAGRPARATALAGFAVEEVGKAAALAVLAVMPENLKAQVPVGRLLEWHQLKLVAGELVAAVPFEVPLTVLARFAAMPRAEIADILDDAQAFALDGRPPRRWMPCSTATSLPGSLPHSPSRSTSPARSSTRSARSGTTGLPRLPPWCC